MPKQMPTDLSPNSARNIEFLRQYLSSISQFRDLTVMNGWRCLICAKHVALAEMYEHLAREHAQEEKRISRLTLMPPDEFREIVSRQPNPPPTFEPWTDLLTSVALLRPDKKLTCSPNSTQAFSDPQAPDKGEGDCANLWDTADEKKVGAGGRAAGGVVVECRAAGSDLDLGRRSGVRLCERNAYSMGAGGAFARFNLSEVAQMPPVGRTFKALLVPIALVMVPISIGIGIGLSDPARLRSSFYSHPREC
ncbi:uncharacterized protein MYCGRDRAFT_97989 [Zymoseptoria tritici IPO323]|uniref:Uncharacterized protein n=1 Tax=Zymoseptoria tritici (strain CBS 115943 / IPO323) TaxID=336722 RepID=F9XRZ9_ZYMTI|nr:uncharacterized protein MYCGRDRAFT_97989 [Zymoseptoria tritici IPO323]EGP82014.1 hypothetical protein MYCGRDRAFT_97989 [Zymoseptoria tritici IPO323]